MDRVIETLRKLFFKNRKFIGYLFFFMAILYASYFFYSVYNPPKDPAFEKKVTEDIKAIELKFDKKIIEEIRMRSEGGEQIIETSNGINPFLTK